MFAGKARVGLDACGVRSAVRGANNDVASEFYLRLIFVAVGTIACFTSSESERESTREMAQPGTFLYIDY